MSDELGGATTTTLLPYLRKLVAFLKEHDPEVWDWFASSRQQEQDAADLRFELLKSTYRVDRDSKPELYEAADEVAHSLQVTAPITIYQAQDPTGFNASLVYLPNEVHVVFHGPIATKLSPAELRALLAHEMTHFTLWQTANGDLLTASDMLTALTNDARAHSAHFASWRLLRLYVEILCDRGALAVTQNLNAVVSMLVKAHTAVDDVNPESYLRQGEEIFARGSIKSEGVTHPEAFIRARALQLWCSGGEGAEEQIRELIEAKTELGELDLLGQCDVAQATRTVIDALLARKWFQTDAALAHARLYFDDYSPPARAAAEISLAEVRVESTSAADYYCFVLLDFATADRELEEVPLAAAITVAERLNIKERFVEAARRELKLRKNQWEKLDRDKVALLEEADRTPAGPA